MDSEKTAAEKNVIRVYFADVSPLADQSLFEKYYSMLSEKRKSKTDRFRFEKDKNLCLGAGILLDRGLMQYNLRENSVKYAHTDKGKPFFADHPQIHFNVSHSGTKVMAVFSDDEVGCDIEKKSEMKNDLARRFFNENEYAAIMEKKETEERDEMFFRFWTLKESFMKATGLGFSLPLNEFEIKLDGGSISAEYGEIGKQYHFAEFDAFPDYRCAVCSKKEIEKTEIFGIEIEQLPAM